MAKLRIYMLDLMGFARRGNGMWVILPDARSKSASFVHHPVVLFNTPPQEGDEWATVADKLKVNPKPEMPRHAWLLDREDILIPRQGGASALSLTNGSDQGFPNGSNARFFSWVPRMHQVFSRCADMESGLTPAKPEHSLPTAAAARMLLTQGTLETATFVKFHDTVQLGEIVLFRFPGGDVSQALTEILVATIPMDGDEITIGTFDHKSGKAGRSITLRENGGYVDMLVANLSPITDGAEKSGKHFQLYYGLSTDPGAVGPMPQAVTRKIIDGVEMPLPNFVRQVQEVSKGGESRPICTFVQFN